MMRTALLVEIAGSKFETLSSGRMHALWMAVVGLFGSAVAMHAAALIIHDVFLCSTAMTFAFIVHGFQYSTR